MIDAKALFDAIRDIKGAPLTKADVDRINRIIAPPAPAKHKVSQAGIDLIHSFESLRLQAYPDPGSSNGLPVTIGWGSTSDLQGRPIKLGDNWTRAQADAKFAQDLERFEVGVAEAIGDAPTTQGQYDALVSLAYNIGLAAFRKSTLLRLHKAGDYDGARAQFARWTLNDGRKLNGLVRRRAAEAALYAQ
jgi:GH24 family phage-related lysozyme (muramidase)